MFAVARYEWSGGENFPKSGGFIAAANHATEIDALTFAHYLFDHGHEPRILAKRGLFTTPVIGSILRATRMIPVDRGTADAGRSLEAARVELAGGACVAIFPEGTITRDPDLWPMEGKTGLARLALATRVPVIPVAQWGAGSILPRYGRVLRPFPRKRVQIRTGPAVDLADLYDRPHDSATLREATTRVLDAITAELETLRGEQAPAARFDLRKHPEYRTKQTVYPPVERP
ncbi:1-acyl-sn-glycerol-3-phosphate acyltransferase [Xylanimonas allomyrinae]|uniref:1-acyl-sn-glycerol-3-phosphate acyltransferase n=2 Tax=Xylanimonas allomyrinae TaxID=2509459 RepID=A0A4P6EPH4_9MICO|nr:lysophospholipid acyltransferase family protein [Xylanimonas allomyrinae]QAY64674.1 1-acyl-sn-glycerol-3-phosphate acyltransferase [Xylanimonas allomyrinae]